MQDFFDFSVWFCKQFVAFVLSLPFMETGSYGSFSYGSVLIALTVICLLIVALIGTVKNWSLSPEAGRAVSDARFASRLSKKP